VQALQFVKDSIKTIPDGFDPDTFFPIPSKLPSTELEEIALKEEVCSLPLWLSLFLSLSLSPSLSLSLSLSEREREKI
jgi:hypothetical protein